MIPVLAGMVGLAVGLAAGWLTWGMRVHRLEREVERRLGLRDDEVVRMGRKTEGGMR